MSAADAPLLDVWCEGRTPLLIDVPHAGTYIPDDLRAALTAHAQNVADADWHVPQLYAFAIERGASLMVATHARYVIDLNRDPQGAALYPGADNSELVPTAGFDAAPLYLPGNRPSAAHVDARRAQYWAPYHARLAQRLEAIRARHGYAILLDAHSIRSRVPRFFDGRLPDLNLGTADGHSCAPSLQTAAMDVLSRAQGFSSVCNGRFKGGYITRHYGEPARGVHALQLEIAQACYMHEDPPWPWDPLCAQPLQSVLRQLVGALLEWRPV